MCFIDDKSPLFILIFILIIQVYHMHPGECKRHLSLNNKDPNFLGSRILTCCDYFLAFLRLRIPKIVDAVPINAIPAIDKSAAPVLGNGFAAGFSAFS